MVAVATATAGHVGVSSRTALSVCPVDMCGCVRLLNPLRTRPSENFLLSDLWCIRKNRNTRLAGSGKIFQRSKRPNLTLGHITGRENFLNV